MCCHFFTIEKLEIYDTISATDVEDTEANKANQRRGHLR
jgi:hypothetical protein